jgi:hypothetical protein
MYQKHLIAGITFALAALALLLAAVWPALASPNSVGNLGNPSIAPPQSHFRGLSYSEWAAAWFQWVFSLPSDHHPLLDTADCSAGQTGNVWFIDGTHGSPFPSSGRHCTIPAGTALFLSLASRNQDNEGCSADDARIERTSDKESVLRMKAHDILNGFLGSRRIVIDGVDVHGLPACDYPDHPATCNSPYRVQSPVFDYTVPALNNLLIIDDGACYDDPYGDHTTPYTALGAVADGVFVMIKPLSVGEHTIEFGLPDPATGTHTRLYFITVTGAGK